MGLDNRLSRCKQHISDIVLGLTQRRNHWQFPRFRDSLNLVRMPWANNLETETDLVLFLHLIKNCGPSRVLPQVRGISHDIETMLGS